MGISEPKRFEPRNWQELLAVAAAIDLGIFEELSREPATAEGLAGRLGYDLRATKMLLLALEDLGHLERDSLPAEGAESGHEQPTGQPGRFRVAAGIAEFVINRESPSYGPNAIVHSRNLLERWLTIPQVVRTGRQVERPYTRKRREVFVRSMHDVSRGAAGEIVDLCLKRRSGARTVLDVGGGPGTYARLFAEKGAEVTILDRPEIIGIMEPELAAWPGIKMVPGDFNEGLPKGGFDIAFMGNVSHIYGPEENLRLLGRVHAALNPEGVAAIVDLVRGRSSRAPLFALTMLVNTDSGGTWTEEQYRTWLETSGFHDVDVFDIEQRDAQLILASPRK